MGVKLGRVILAGTLARQVQQQDAISVLRRKAHGRRKGRRGLAVSAGAESQESRLTVDVRLAGPQSERLIAIGERFLIAAGQEEGDGSRHVMSRPFWKRVDHGIAIVDGVLEPAPMAALSIACGLAEIGFLEIGRELDRAVELCRGEAVLAAPLIDGAAHAVRAGANDLPSLVFAVWPRKSMRTQQARRDRKGAVVVAAFHRFFGDCREKNAK